MCIRDRKNSVFGSSLLNSNERRLLPFAKLIAITGLNASEKKKLKFDGFSRTLPVSYTHLDVYKRQKLTVICEEGNSNPVFLKAERTLLRDSFTAVSGKPTISKHGTPVHISHSIDIGYAFNPYKPMTVSYTHLDVYKRQMWGCTDNQDVGLEADTH